jgi:rfaE bifunctional protein nucleotidyltransferase chain/domain
MNAPVLSHSNLLEAIAGEREKGRTVAFANGCFDVLHVGHVRYLQDASNVADVLVVAVNSDRSVRVLKGEGRPVMPQDERAEIISAIRGVGYVTIFDEDTPRVLLEILRPDFQCKGTDYAAETVPEAELVQSWGGKVVITGDPKNHSTTEILSKMKQR